MPNSQQLLADWFTKSTEMAEASLKAAAEIQLASLDRFMRGLAAMGQQNQFSESAQQFAESARQFAEPGIPWVPGFGRGSSGEQEGSGQQPPPVEADEEHEDGPERGKRPKARTHRGQKQRRPRSSKARGNGKATKQRRR